MDRGAWRATVRGVAESDMTEYTHNTTLILQPTGNFDFQVLVVKKYIFYFISHS